MNCRGNKRLLCAKKKTKAIDRKEEKRIDQDRNWLGSPGMRGLFLK